MPYCMNCGQQMPEGAKFCSSCGTATGEIKTDTEFRKTIYEGELHKCPSCGEVLKAFEINCPACGHELRGTKVSSAVKEFALKLEAIESRREYEKPRGLFAASQAMTIISKTDEQKISLIKSFAVPNSKEDMLEFMILATSNINLNVYDSYKSAYLTKGEKEVNAAWFAKIQQVYEKAKRSYSTDKVFDDIKRLYDKCHNEISFTKKKGIVKWVLLFGWMPAIIIWALATQPQEEKKELERLENIVLEVQDAMEKEEYTHALRLANSIDYQRYDVEMERKWDIQKEYWVEKVIETALDNGVELEYTPTEDVDKANDDETDNKSSGGFIEGFKDGLKSGIEDAEASN